MNKYFFLIFISIILSISALSQSQTRKVPSVDIKTIDGKTFNTDSISNSGKPIIISFWETFCKPCINEFEAISEVYADWQKETGVKLMAVSIDNSRTSSKVPSMVKTNGWEFEVYMDINQDFKRAMSISYCPYSFLIDGLGNIVWEKGAYAEGDEEKLYELVKKVAKGEKIK